MTPRRTWKDTVRSILPWQWYWKLKRLREEIRAGLTDESLTALAKIYKTDKWGYHFYTPIYDQWFARHRNSPVTLLEIGVGGYNKTHLGGDSLRMWKRYFPQGKILGLDIYDKSALEERRIQMIRGDQSDANSLKEIAVHQGPFDIIIDDGSHIQSHIITSFETLFPFLRTGGIYIIEDTQTSYWSKFEGSSTHMHEVPSAMNYFIERVHTVNRTEWEKDGNQTDIPDQGIGSIAFYHNMIFVVKG
jgi:hypothetical protein